MKLLLYVYLIICLILQYLSFKTRNFKNKHVSNNENEEENLNFVQSKVESLNKLPNITAKNQSWLNQTRETISEMVYRIINSNTGVGQSKGEFMTQQRGRFDFTMNDAELKELFYYMLYKQDKVINDNSLNVFATLYVRDWVMCDSDFSGVMTFNEFKSCMTNSTFLNFIVPPPKEFASRPVYNNTEFFYNTIFRILDTKKWGYLNFLQFMYLRLYAFSWRYCSVFGPYIDENSFECAIEIVSNYKTLSKAKMRNLYKFGLELSYIENYRNMDFISFMQIAEPIRLFAKINSKEDEEIVRNEFERALDTGTLPQRYTQDIINMFFFLTDQKSRFGESIDLQTFVFYDFFLTVFDIYSLERPAYLSKAEFFEVINYPNDLFPSRMRDEIGLIPQYNLTSKSYKMYMFSNVLYSEKDHLYKAFVENSAETVLKDKSTSELKITNLNNAEFKKSNLKAKSKEKMTKFSTRSRTNYDINQRPIYYPIRSYFHNLTTTEKFYNVTFSMNSTSMKLFDMLDLDNDGYINFYDFGNFAQIAWMFSNEDRYLRGRIAAEILREKIADWGEFPAVSYRTKDRAFRLTQLAPDTLVDMMSLIEVLKIDDAIRIVARRENDPILGELELKRVLQLMNMQYVPDAKLNQCLRGLTQTFIPRYDWECAFTEGLKCNLKYFEANDYYQLSKLHQIGLKTTSFFNIDPPYV